MKGQGQSLEGKYQLLTHTAFTPAAIFICRISTKHQVCVNMPLPRCAVWMKKTLYSLYRGMGRMKYLIFIVLQRGHSEPLHPRIHFCQRYNVQPWYNVILSFGLLCCIGKDGWFGMLLPWLGRIMPYLCKRLRQNAAITLENWNVKAGLAFPAIEIGFRTYFQTLMK